jgi:hypothetical protein
MRKTLVLIVGGTVGLAAALFLTSKDGGGINRRRRDSDAPRRVSDVGGTGVPATSLPSTTLTTSLLADAVVVRRRAGLRRELTTDHVEAGAATVAERCAEAGCAVTKIGQANRSPDVASESPHHSRPQLDGAISLQEPSTRRDAFKPHALLGACPSGRTPPDRRVNDRYGSTSGGPDRIRRPDHRMCLLPTVIRSVHPRHGSKSQLQPEVEPQPSQT